MKQSLAYCYLVYAFNIGFYALPLMGKIGYADGFTLLAMLNVATMLALSTLIFTGKAIREKQGLPKEHEDL